MSAIIELDKQAGQKVNDFHALRLSFNQAFLNEDYTQAAKLCADAVPLCQGNDILLEELARFHTLLGDVDKALHCSKQENWRINLNNKKLIAHFNGNK